MLLQSLVPRSGTDNKPTKLADCRIRYACLFSIISPLAGYIYTGRFRQLGLFMVGGLAALTCAYKLSPALRENARSHKIVAGLSIGGVAAADNSLAILLARRKIKRKSQWTDEGRG